MNIVAGSAISFRIVQINNVGLQLSTFKQEQRIQIAIYNIKSITVMQSGHFQLQIVRQAIYESNQLSKWQNKQQSMHKLWAVISGQQYVQKVCANRRAQGFLSYMQRC
ncbi:Hypothetical_protein [Hexamita inflata]|uniref:Hypothetical_protein n=1 Tax=Hexamita inflata TaxID=28002 RepID=A0AA86UQT0_9EUKA|nr:Hypothetical protein HINF_LOCUS52019 [Hexamita inflata]